MLAHRTSPTDIGMGLVSVLSAYDLGYLGARDVASRIERTLRTIASLESHAGHLLNWYDTRSLAPLLPRYVSTVDSGNLAAALITVAQGLRTLKEDGDERLLAGVSDTCALLAEALGGLARASEGVRAASEPVQGALGRVQEALSDAAPARRRLLLTHAAAHLRRSVEGLPRDSAELGEAAYWALAVAANIESVTAPPDEALPGALEALAS